MGWLIAFGILFLLAILPLGASVKYNADGPLIRIIGGPIRLTVFPRQKKDKKENKPKKEKKDSQILNQLGLSHYTSTGNLKKSISEKGLLSTLKHFAGILKLVFSTLGQVARKFRVCRAKLEVLCGLREGGYLILNGDEPLLRNVKGKSYHTVYVSLECEKADLFAKNIRVESDCTRFDAVCFGKEMRDLRIRVLGRHTVYAALYTLAAGLLVGLSEEELRRGLLSFSPEGMRQRVCELGRITVIEDCYNASPESMIAAIDVLDAYSRQNGRRSVAVLGPLAVTAVCLLLTAAHLCYAVYAYQHCSIIQFIAKEPW